MRHKTNYWLTPINMFTIIGRCTDANIYVPNELEFINFQIAVVAVMCKPHRCPHINMTGNICV